MYTDETTTQVVIAMLKAYNIKNIVVSPGTRNSGFAASIQSDPFFNVYSVIDERSAAYFATGISFETGEPVVISCTGATASRNYLSALTEAYYRNIPIIALTFAHEVGNAYNYAPQHLDRSISQNDIKLCSVVLPKVVDNKSRRECELLLNVALTKCMYGRKGPVHIDVAYLGVKFNVPNLPSVKKAKYTSVYDLLNLETICEIAEELENKKIGVFIGEHRKFSNLLLTQISQFAKKYHAPVFVDHTSNYYGENKILIGQISDICLTQNIPDIMIDIGGISGQYSQSRLFENVDVWRISEMGEIRQRAGSITRYFDCREEFFFEKFVEVETDGGYIKYAEQIKEEIDNLATDNLPNSGPESLPFSGAFVASKLLKKIPQGSSLHVSILNSLRSINFFNVANKITTNCNVGGFGIDGPISTLIGQAVANKNKLVFAQVGDLAFFYDMNILANRHLPNNLRIILINNGQGVEFRINTWLNRELGKDKIEPFISARGHNGSAKNWAETCGFVYMSAKNKKEYLDNLAKFCNPNLDHFKGPVLFEIFVQAYDDVVSVKTLRGKPQKK